MAVGLDDALDSPSFQEMYLFSARKVQRDTLHSADFQSHVAILLDPNVTLMSPRANVGSNKFAYQRAR